MAAVPKERISIGRKNRRRSQQKLRATMDVACPNCGKERLPHRVCLNCGYYRGRKVL
ncbi:MAG: 50S ribosomal protein L32 [Patescibacteria group bacterium]|nr:50S ribosomal protein L32 [Patescibacteria group bacterium]